MELRESEGEEQPGELQTEEPETVRVDQTEEPMAEVPGGEQVEERGTQGSGS